MGAEFPNAGERQVTDFEVLIKLGPQRGDTVEVRQPVIVDLLGLLATPFGRCLVGFTTEEPRGFQEPRRARRTTSPGWSCTSWSKVSSTSRSPFLIVSVREDKSIGPEESATGSRALASCSVAVRAGASIRSAQRRGYYRGGRGACQVQGNRMKFEDCMVRAKIPGLKPLGYSHWVSSGPAPPPRFRAIALVSSARVRAAAERGSCPSAGRRRLHSCAVVIAPCSPAARPRSAKSAPAVLRRRPPGSCLWTQRRGSWRGRGWRPRRAASR